MKYIYWCWGTWEDIWCAYFFSEFYKYETNTELSRLKTGSRKYGRDTPLSSSCPISIFFVNTKMGEINIKIWAGRNCIFSIRFHPYTCRCRCRQQARRAWRLGPGMARRQHQPSSQLCGPISSHKAIRTRRSLNSLSKENISSWSSRFSSLSSFLPHSLYFISHTIYPSH